MPRATWDALRTDQPEGSGCDAQYPYHTVVFRCGDDEPWIQIGVRHKRGDQRGLDTDQKPPLKLDFNRVVPGQRWPAELGELGFRKLTLNTGQPDNPGGVLSALLTEHLAWRLMRAEVPTASRSAYARLTVHFTDGEPTTEYHGIYILIEDIDRTAIRWRYLPDDGTLLKTTTGSCRDQVVYDHGPPNAAADGVAAWLALDPADFAGSWAERTDQAIALEELLRQEALRDLLANGADTVLGRNYSNYFSYDPREGRRVYLPWDLDDAFRPFPQDLPPDTPLEASCSPIGEHTRCVPEIRQRYLEIACQLLNGTLAPERLLAQVDALDGLLRTIIAEEDELVWPEDDPLDPSAEGTYAWQLAELETWIPARVEFARASIEAEGVTCPETCETGATEECSYLRCPGVRRCEDGRWTTCLVDPALEEPDNLIDDDCDRAVDETAGGSADAGPGEPGEPGRMIAGGACGCGAAGEPSQAIAGALLLLVALAWPWRPRARCAAVRATRTPRART